MKKQYKLLKDLPLAKAGEIVSINEQNRKKHLDEIAIMWERGTIAYVHKDNIDDWLKEIRESKSVFNLEFGDDLYVICHGFVNRETFCWLNYQFDYIEQGNWFASKEEAEIEFSKRIVIREIQKYCFENKIDNSWDEHDRNYAFCFNTEKWDATIMVCTAVWKIYSSVWFFSYKNAQKILEQFPEELKLIYS